MTREEAEKIIKERFKPVEDKPGYVWFSHFQMISIETLAKSLEKWCPKSLYNTPLAESEGKALEQEPKTGHWIKSKDGYMRCDQCGSRGSAIKARFCHHCGAKMFEPKERSKA